MKRVADAGEPVVAIPAIVVAVDVHVPLAIPAVEVGPLCEVSSVPPLLEYSRSCILFGIVMPQHLTPSIFVFSCTYTTLFETVVANTPDVWILISVAGNM